MVYHKLKFEKNTLPKDKDLNEDRPYIDFIIDGLPLINHLGGSEAEITPFGWGNNIEFELTMAKRLLTFEKSKLSNGLQSAYVCARCGDEGCGAIMFDIVNHGAYVEWNNFVDSDGEPTELGPDEKIDVDSFYFELEDYQKAIGQLIEMIKGND